MTGTAKKQTDEIPIAPPGAPTPANPPALSLVPPPKPSEPQETARRFSISIGTKFLTLILATLLLAVSVIVFNATNLFQKDNLNNIYVASDLLTAAKAGEVRSWLSGLIQKGTLFGKILLAENSGAPGTVKILETDSDLLTVTLFKKGSSSNGAYFNPEKTWNNPNVLKAMNLSEDQVNEMREAIQVPFEKVGAGTIAVSSYVSAEGQPLLSMSLPLVQESPGVFSVLVSVVARQEKLLESFSDSGAYTLALVDGAGIVLAHPDGARVKDRENMSTVPIVRKMLESTLDRGFTEFSIGKEQFLGAFAKVGFAGLGVVNSVPRARAFEAGQTLVRRSLLIALLVLSAAFVVAYLFAQTLVSPIIKLSNATAEVASGNFNVRVTVKTRDEIAKLAKGFNKMSGEIERKIQNLSRINESSKIISSTLDTTKLTEFSLDTLVALLNAESGIAWLWNPSATPEEKPSFGLVVKRNWRADVIDPNDPLFAEAVKASQPALLNLGGSESPSAIAVPIVEKSGVTGYVVLRDRKDGRKFGDEDLFMAGTIMTSVGITFENIALLKETANKARMEKELETAKLVQETMFPPTENLLPGIELQSYYTPAGECGGDWWGMIPLPNDRVLVAIGDATGHGVPAALVTASAKAACSVIHRISQDVPEIASSPGTVLHFLNKAIYESTLGKILMTFFVAVIDGKTGETIYATASHDPIYWYKMPEGATPENGSKNNLDVLLSPPGPRLGQGPIAKYEEGRIHLKPKDLIIFYTDGLPEGKSPAKDEYGERKFMRSLGKHAHATPKEFRDGILKDFHGFIESEPLHDDVTLVVCKYDPDSRKA